MGMSLRLVEESRCKSVDTALVTSRPTAAEYDWEVEGEASIAQGCPVSVSSAPRPAPSERLPRPEKLTEISYSTIS